MKRAPRSRVLGFRVAYGAGAARRAGQDHQVLARAASRRSDAGRAARRSARARCCCTASRSRAVLRDAPVKPWLAASIAGDLNDIAATFARPRRAAGRRGAEDRRGRGRLGALLHRLARSLAPRRERPAARAPARARHRPPHVGPGARAPRRRARRVRARHAGLRRRPPALRAATASADARATLARGASTRSSRLGVERPHVAGNSLGGWVALSWRSRVARAR